MSLGEGAALTTYNFDIVYQSGKKTTFRTLARAASHNSKNISPIVDSFLTESNDRSKQPEYQTTLFKTFCTDETGFDAVMKNSKIRDKSVLTLLPVDKLKWYQQTVVGKGLARETIKMSTRKC